MRRVVILLFFCTLIGATFGTTLDLDFQYPTTMSGSDIWITFETTDSGANGIAGTYTDGVSGLSESLNVIYSGTYQYQQDGTTFTSGQTNYWTESLNLAQLSNGVSFTTGASMRAYVSLGSPLVFSGSGITGGLLSFGEPSYSNTSDPNWNIRWDVAEVTISNPPSTGDQGDVTAINGIAIPMKLTSYNGTTPVQSTQTATNFTALQTALNGPGGYYDTNNANNTNPGVAPSDPYVTGTGGEFLRAIGLNNGAHAGADVSVVSGTTVYATNDNATASIGSNNTFGAYVNNIQTNGIVTPLGDRQVNSISGTLYGFTGSLTAVTWDNTGTYNATWVNSTGGTSTGSLDAVTTAGTGAALQVGGNFNVGGSSIGSFSVIIPPDVVTGTASGTFSNYIQTNTITGGDPSENYGLIFKFTPTGTTQSTYYNYNDFVAAVNAADPNNQNQGAMLIQQVFHDASAGLNFGLVGSNVIDPISGTSFNEEGSQAWTDIWETLAHGGTYTGTNGVVYSYANENVPTLPLYAAAQGTDNGFYNQWAATVYDSSTTAYGNPYSDYLQPVDVNLLGSGTLFDITHDTLTLFPDETVPEASAWALVLLGVVVVFIIRRGFPPLKKDEDPQL